ncbi:hypothetical protein [Streptomyces mirabilis]|uniref:hypothetical protein n=1 Tax=Streptomyces mirabilis TaxID=68239 RepID=UPI0036BEBE4D
MASTSLTFTLEGRDRLSRVLDKAGDSASTLEKRLAMVGAAIPAAAALAPLVAQTGAAAVAVAAFGAAIVPQIGALSDASKAQTKYEAAVAKSGVASEAAVSAHVAVEQQMAKMPPATRAAAVGLSALKNQYSAWSDALAGDTMPVFTKGLAVASAMLPKLTPLVKGASTELNRFMTTVAGGVNTAGFDRISSKFSDFATGSLKRANDGLIHLLRTFDTAKVGGSLSQFMDYARQQGPLLASTLKNVATAALNLLQAASGVGVGLLQLANAAAKVVGALPPGFITVLMQTAIAIRAVTLATKGIQLAAGAYALVRAQIAAMGTAAIGASGAVGTLRAMFMALSVTARTAVAATGIGLLTIALIKLSSIGKKTPPDVDKLTTALGRLGQTGQVTGEAASKFGTHFEKLKSQMDKVLDPSISESVNNWGHHITGGFLKAGDATEELNGSFKSIDESLANMVRGGNAKLAAAALKDMLSHMRPDQVKKLQGSLDKYKSALADAKFEQDLATQAMGIFGSQARETQATLDAQKQSADGLRASIVALNDVNRSAYDAQISFEASVDSLTESFKKNGATLDIHTEKGRQNGQAMSAAAKSQDELIASGLAAGDSLGSMTKKSGELRREMLKLATEAFDGNKKKATEYVNTLLGVPSEIETLIKAEKDEAVAGLKSVQSEIQKTPGAKTITVGTLNAAAIKALESVGLKTRQLPDGKTEVYTANGSSLGNIAAVRRALDALNGKTAKTYTSNYILTVRETRSVYNTVGRPTSGEGGVSKYASGGTPKAGEVAWVGEEGPELVTFGSAARVFDHRTSMAMAGNTVSAGNAAAQGLAVGLGATSGVHAAARTLAAAVEAGVREELQIASPSKKMKALAADIGKGLIVGLTGSQAKIKSVAADLAKDIRTAFSGRKESNLVGYVNRQTGKLLAAAKKRDAIAAKIAEAKKYASDVTSAARESAGLSNLGMQPEEVTAGGIKAGLGQKLAQIKQFTKYVDILAKKGLNKGLLRQILNMGPDTGYAYASALVGADKNTFKSINSLQGQLDKSTTTLGQVGADGLYDAGKNAGRGFLKGLEGQQKDIEKLMMSIAKGMQKAIKKALGIKSPSTVMAQLGRYSTQGLARGLVDGVPILDRALDVVSGRVAGTQPVIGRPAATGGAGAGTVIYFTVDVRPGGTADWEAIRRGLLSLKRHHGANVNLGLGGVTP